MKESHRRFVVGTGEDSCLQEAVLDREHCFCYKRRLHNAWVDHVMRLAWRSMYKCAVKRQDCGCSFAHFSRLSMRRWHFMLIMNLGYSWVMFSFLCEVPLLPRVTVHVNVRVNGHFFVRDILYLVNRKKKTFEKWQLVSLYWSKASLTLLWSVIVSFVHWLSKCCKQIRDKRNHPLSAGIAPYASSLLS